MGASKTTKEESSTSQLNPYAPTIPALQTIVNGGLDLYNRGIGSGVYGGDRTAGFSDPSKAAQNYLVQNAGAGLPNAQASSSLLGNLIANGGATADTRAATDGLMSVGPTSTAGLTSAAARLSDPNSMTQQAAGALTGGRYALDASGYDALNQGLAGPSQTQSSLEAVARGDYLGGGGNAYIDDIIARSNANARTAAQRNFGVYGGAGSSLAANAIADAVAGNETNLRFQNYENERARQAQAAQAIDAQTLARTGARQSLYGSSNDVRSANAGQLVTGANLAQSANQAGLAGQQVLYGAEADNAARRIGQYGTALTAAQGNRTAAQNAIGQVAGVTQQLLQPGATLAGVGAAQDAQRQAELDAARSYFDEREVSPWKSLGLLAGTTLPIATSFGQQVGKATATQSSNPGLLNSILGGALGLAGTAADLGKAAPGLLALISDERLKEDVRPVGETNDGQTIYSYRYKGEPHTQMGLLAQEVARTHPDAVAKGPGGVLAVDYKRATDDAARKGPGGADGNGSGISLEDALRRLSEEIAAERDAQAKGGGVELDPGMFADPHEAALALLEREVGQGQDPLANLRGRGGSPRRPPRSTPEELIAEQSAQVLRPRRRGRAAA